MGRTLFLHMVLRKFIEFTNNKPVFSQYNTFYKYKYFFLESVFWSLFNNRQKGQSNQEQWSLCCSLPGFRVLLWTHYGPFQWFSTCFRKSKEFGVLGPYFQTMLFLVTMVKMKTDFIGFTDQFRIYRLSWTLTWYIFLYSEATTRDKKKLLLKILQSSQ